MFPLSAYQRFINQREVYKKQCKNSSQTVGRKRLIPSFPPKRVTAATICEILSDLIYRNLRPFPQTDEYFLEIAEKGLIFKQEDGLTFSLACIVGGLCCTLSQ